MKRLTFALAVCLLTLGGNAWAMEKWQNWCMNGGVKVSIPGQGVSTTKFMQSYPSCTVTVYDAGTSNLSTIYSDNSSTPKSNPFTADSITGYSFFYAANGTYDVKFSGTGISVPFTLSGFLLNDNSGGTINPKIVDTIRFCDQYGGQTDTAIQACLNDTPDGGSAFLSQGTWTMCGALPITITKNVTLTGAGWPSTAGGGTKLSVCGGASGTTDVFQIVPPLNTVLYGGVIKNFAIWPASGTPARYAFYLDGTNGAIANWIFDHVWVEQLGGAAVYAEGPGYNTFHSPQGTPVLTTFQNSYLRGGLTFTNSGDTNRIINNQITGNGTSVDYSAISGATGFQVLGNNITSNGGMHFGTNVVMPVIQHNEFETFGTFTGSNGAVIDFDGAASPKIQQGNIKDNHISVVNGIVADAVRLNYAQGVIVEGNNFGLGAAGSHDVIATSNSAVNKIGDNNFGDFTYATIFSDSGTGNIFQSFNNAAGSGTVFANNKPIQYFDNGGTVRNVLNAASGAVTLYGYQGRFAVSSSDPATYLYDGTGSNNISLATSSSASTQPVSSTYTTVANFVARNAIIPSSAGGIAIGNGSLPFSSLYLGSAATNNIRLTGTATSAKVATFPDNTGTVAELNLAQSWTAAQTTNSQIISTLATGTAPLVIASTTPVANLTAVPLAYNHSGTQQTAYHLVQDTCTLGTDCGVTLAGSAVYTSLSSYTCTCQDETAIGACKVAQSSGSAFTITGTGTDVIRYQCGGN